jgi:hypothetical protein
MRESYLIALENVVNVKTHSVLTGTASVGDVITVTRTGDFPLWDGSFMSDTVTTSMTASQDGGFMYHVNPSTRPFVSSRTVPNLSNPLIEIDESGATTLPPAIGSTDITVNVPAGAGRLVATLSSLALDQDDYDLELRDPSGNLVASAASLGSAETVQATSEDGLAVGTWTLTVINFAGVSPWTLTGGVYEPGDILTPETPEFWTVSCNGRAGIDVLVARGASADVGNLC